MLQRGVEEEVDGGPKKTRAWLRGGRGGGRLKSRPGGGKSTDRSRARKGREPAGREGLDRHEEAEPPRALPANPGQVVPESVPPSLPVQRAAPSSRRLLPCGGTNLAQVRHSPVFAI